MKRQRCQDKKETERTPFDDLSRISVLVVSLENEVGANIDILLVGTEFCLCIDDAKEHE